MAGNDSGKGAVLAAVANKESVFRASDITEESGVSRQLVYYHLNLLMAQGFIEKQGLQYIITDRSGVVQALVACNFVYESTSPFETQFLGQERLDLLLAMIENVRAARALEIPGTVEVKAAANEELSKTIRSYTLIKKQLNADLNRKKAKKLLNRAGHADFYEALQRAMLNMHVTVPKETREAIEMEYNS